MDWQTLINVGGTVGLTVLGWYLSAQKSAAKDATDRQEALKQELTNFRIEVARDYVTTHDLADIKTTLVRIETKLDAKADK
jgi:uncharacterized protein with GYD domain